MVRICHPHLLIFIVEDQEDDCRKDNTGENAVENPIRLFLKFVDVLHGLVLIDVCKAQVQVEHSQGNKDEQALY